MESKYISTGENVVKMMAKFLDADTVEAYLLSGVEDEKYQEILNQMRIVRIENKITYLYVINFTVAGSYFIFDSGDDEIRYRLGFFDEWNSNVMEEDKIPFLTGSPVPPKIYNSNLIGRTLTVYEPMIRPNGEILKGYYIAADYSVEQLHSEYRHYLLFLSCVSIAVAALFAFIHWIIVLHIVVKPINTMVKSAESYHCDESNDGEQYASSLELLAVHTRDELETLASSLKNMEDKIVSYSCSLNEANIKASTDPLTRLHNREAFYNNVTAMLSKENEGGNEGDTHAFMILDIDVFKHINDTYGHAVGDDVLIKCAGVLSHLFRRIDEVARIGGDEFTVFCYKIGNREMIEQKARLILDGFAQIHPVDGAESVTASIGIVLLSGKVDYETLFQKADDLLYIVKARGRNGLEIQTV
jgi:diguanylate cyclase (GGDEF)-like protein